MAAIDYPCRLPGVLVNGPSHSSKDVVYRNDLASGPPIFTTDDDAAYDIFDVVWRFNGIQKQVFDSWFKGSLTRGAKLFNIDLWIDGFDGTKNTKTHECYFNGVPQSAQQGRLWTVSAQLLAIEDQILDECDSESLINLFNGFDYSLDQALSDVDGLIVQLENTWQP